MESDSLIEASYVSLSAQIVVCGINTRNIDPERDRCEASLCQRTGGVYVTRNGDCTYLSPMVVAHVDLKAPPSLQTPQVTHGDTPLLDERQVTEDEILVELGYMAKEKLEAAPKRRGRKPKIRE